MSWKSHSILWHFYFQKCSTLLIHKWSLEYLWKRVTSTIFHFVGLFMIIESLKFIGTCLLISFSWTKKLDKMYIFVMLWQRMTCGPRSSQEHHHKILSKRKMLQLMVLYMVCCFCFFYLVWFFIYFVSCLYWINVFMIPAWTFLVWFSDKKYGIRLSVPGEQEFSCPSVRPTYS